MSYAFALSACCGCGRAFFYNPTWVPSVRINGVREPICLDSDALEKAGISWSL